MSLNYEMARYTELTGEDGTKVSVSRLGGFLDSYEKGRADVIAEIHTELITEIAMLNATDMSDVNLYTFAVRIKEITDKLKEQK